VIKAVLWDVDGTLAETERDGHLVAFNQAFESLKLDRRWSESRYARLLAIAGGRERILYDMADLKWGPSDAERRQILADRIHKLKNELYAKIAASGALRLRDGVPALLDDCLGSGVLMAIVTTTSRANIAALLDATLGKDWRAAFAAVVCAEDAPRKKPDPSAYILALRTLGLRPQDVIAIEDAPAGISAARMAQVPVLVSFSHYFPNPEVRDAFASGPTLGDAGDWTPCANLPRHRVDLEQIIAWRRHALDPKVRL
jgi:HAD superfamily hydrolase (TIGR01509 family)